MATDTINVGDHRYRGDEPITITGQPYQGVWQYVHGHVQIGQVTLVDFLPNAFKSKR